MNIQWGETATTTDNEGVAGTSAPALDFTFPPRPPFSGLVSVPQEILQ